MLLEPAAHPLAILIGENYVKEDWEQVMEDDAQEVRTERFQVLEFWGNIDMETLKDFDVEIPAEVKDEEEGRMKKSRNEEGRMKGDAFSLRENLTWQERANVVQEQGDERDLRQRTKASCF